MNIFKTIMLLSYISVASASAAIITPALPILQHYFSTGHGAIELVVTLFLVGYMVGQLLYGPLANRLGRLGALRLGFTINLVGIAICLLSSPTQSYSLLLIGRLVTALGASAGLSCTFMLINELMEETQAKQALSYAVVSFTLGFGVSIFISGFITQYLSWTVIFWLLMLHGVIMLISTWLFSEPLQQKQSIHIGAIVRGYLSAFRSQELVIFALFLGFVSSFSYCYSTAAPMVAHSYLNIAPASYGSWNLLTMIGMLAGALTAAPLMKAFSTTKMLLITVALFSLGLVSFIAQLSLQSHSLIWFFATATYLYFFASWLFPCSSYFASNAISDRANASAAMNFINMASAMCTVTIMGYLPWTAFASFIVVLAVFLGLCMTFYMVRRTAMSSGS